MAVIKEFEPIVVDEDNVFAVAEATNFAASVLLQMLIEQRGHGPWVNEVRENMRNSLDRSPPPDGWPFGDQVWRDAQHRAIDAIFAHQHMVGSVKPKN